MHVFACTKAIRRLRTAKSTNERFFSFVFATFDARQCFFLLSHSLVVLSLSIISLYCNQVQRSIFTCFHFTLLITLKIVLFMLVHITCTNMIKTSRLNCFRPDNKTVKLARDFHPKTFSFFPMTKTKTRERKSI